MPTYQWVSPTGHIEPSGDWANPANAYDGNWNNYANVTAHYYDPPTNYYWTNYLTLTLAAIMYIDRVRFKYRNFPSYRKLLIEVYNQSTGSWEQVMFGGEGDGYPPETRIEIIIPTVYTDRLRIRAELSGEECYLYELEVEQVIPDSPSPPAPPPPNAPEVYQKEEKKTTGQPPQATTRIRTLHRTTCIAPWIV